MDSRPMSSNICIAMFSILTASVLWRHSQVRLHVHGKKQPNQMIKIKKANEQALIPKILEDALPWEFGFFLYAFAAST